MRAKACKNGSPEQTCRFRKAALPTFSFTDLNEGYSASLGWISFDMPSTVGKLQKIHGNVGEIELCVQRKKLRDKEIYELFLELNWEVRWAIF